MGVGIVLPYFIIIFTIHGNLESIFYPYFACKMVWFKLTVMSMGQGAVMAPCQWRVKEKGTKMRSLCCLLGAWGGGQHQQGQKPNSVYGLESTDCSCLSFSSPCIPVRLLGRADKCSESIFYSFLLVPLVWQWGWRRGFLPSSRT